MSNEVIIIYGEMGVGKSFVARVISQELNCDFIEGDDLLPVEMAAKVSKFKFFTSFEFNRFMKRQVLPALIRAGSNKRTVFCQALYKFEHRNFIDSALREHGIKPIWVYVPVHSVITQMRQLFSRKLGAAWVLYAIAHRPFFQVGSQKLEITIFNNKSESTLRSSIYSIFNFMFRDQGNHAQSI